MDSTRFLVKTLFCLMLTFQTFAWVASSLSSSVITRNHRRLKGSTFKSFSSVSLIECGLQCQRQPRCVSTNFRKTSSLHETGGVCELSEQRTVTPSVGNEDLEYEEGAVYTQLRDTKDCQLNSCLNGGLCTFVETLKTFSCIDHCAGNPCVNGGSCRNLAEGYKCSCIEGQFTGKNCEQVCPVPLGMESGAILNSQISASSQWNSNLAPHQARLNFKGGKGGAWSSKWSNSYQWLQVDLGSNMTVTHIATQGRRDADQWVTKYKIVYRKDGPLFRFMSYRKNADTSAATTFPGNTDKNTVVRHNLNPFIEARYVRVRPVAWVRQISMRMELYTNC